MDIKCSFGWNSFGKCGDFYSCCLNQAVPEDVELNIIGEHKDGKTNNDVVQVHSWMNKARIPKGLTKYFPNMRILDLMIKELSKNDLIEYKNLEKIALKSNEIECLPGDLLDGFNNLEYISLNFSKLKVIEPNILLGLDKLKHIDLREDESFGGLFCSIYPSDTVKISPEDFQSQIIVKFFRISQNLIENFMSKFDNPVEELTKYETLCLDASTKHKIACLRFNKFEHQSSLKIQELKDAMDILKQENLKLSSKSSLTDDIKAFINDKSTKDFKIIIDGHEFPVHKFLLTARSPTLAEILKNNPGVETLNLVDISVDIFEKIIKFLYTDELPGGDGMNFMHLFAAAGRLKMIDLVNYAALKIIETLTTENAFEILSLSNKYEHEELRQKAFNEIKLKYTRIEFKDEWALKPEILMKIIDVYEKKLASVMKLEDDLKNMMLEDIKV